MLTAETAYDLKCYGCYRNTTHTLNRRDDLLTGTVCHRCGYTRNFRYEQA